MTASAVICACNTDAPPPQEFGGGNGESAALPSHTEASQHAAEDLYGVVILTGDSLIFAELDTIAPGAAVPDIGFSLKGLDEDPAVAASASGDGRLQFERGTLFTSTVAPLRRPQMECRFFPTIGARVIGERDSAVFVRTGALAPAATRVLSPDDSAYQVLTRLARDHERNRDVFSNKAVARRPAAVSRVVLFEGANSRYAVVSLSRRDDDLDAGGRQEYTGIFWADRVGRYVPDGEFYSESDAEGKGIVESRVLFAATDVSNRPVLITVTSYWGGGGGEFHVRLAEGDWRQFGTWGSGC